MVKEYETLDGQKFKNKQTALEHTRKNLVKPIPGLQCNGCRACCIGMAPDLHPCEDASQYKTEALETGGLPRLRSGKDGACVYLSKTGCSIYERRPINCRIYDCRVFAHRRLLDGEPYELQDTVPMLEGLRRFSTLPAEILERIFSRLRRLNIMLGLPGGSSDRIDLSKLDLNKVAALLGELPYRIAKPYGEALGFRCNSKGED